VKLGLVFVLAAALVAVPAAAAAPRSPVVKLKTSEFGVVLATPKKLALYYWTPEKRDGRIHCSGSCAKLWPPLVVRSAAAVPNRIAGFRGTFGTIRRPDGRLQVTYKRLPLYTYVHDPPGKVLCNNVDGWFVVRA
jgi:predicted lipoprotein with Yx(FWY)xxD motif